jgi:hypothetical protein
MVTKKILLKELKTIYPYYKNINKYKVDEINEIINKNCNNFINILNDRNSCYLDSFLIALFHDGNEYIKSLFLDAEPINHKNKTLTELALNIKDEMKNIYNTIISNNNKLKKNNCSNLRKLFQNYYNIIYPKNTMKWTKEQLESLDVINILNIIFNIKKENKIIIKSYASNSKKKIIILKNSKLVRNEISNKEITTIIPVEKLLSGKDIYIKKMFPNSTDNIIFDDDNLWKPYDNNETYKRKIDKITYLSAKILFIHINRNNYMDGTGNKLLTKIIPSLNIKLKNNKSSLYLRSIIVHIGDYKTNGHYICLYECKGKWYIYDDMTPKIKLLGTFEDLCNYNNGFYLENCTNLLYW